MGSFSPDLSSELRRGTDPANDALTMEFFLARDDGNDTGWAILEFSVIAEDFEGFDPGEVCP